MLDIESLRHADFYGRHDSARSLPLARNDMHSKQMLFRGDGPYMDVMRVADLGHVLLQIGLDIGNADTRRHDLEQNMAGRLDDAPGAAQYDQRHKDRSEENKSELQTIMSISYADFCLKKKKKKDTK